MAARSKSSTEGAEVQSVAETAQDGRAPVPPTETPPIEPEASTALATTQATEPGLPSPHQLHARNWIEKTRVDWQLFRNGHDALVSELSGLDSSHDAVQAQRKAEFDAETKRIADAHELKREELVARINDMLDGLAVTERAIEHYNERMNPQTKNLDGEQQEQQA